MHAIQHPPPSSRHHASLFLSLLLLSATPTHEANTWAVIASTSRYWYNYRHMANALAMYHTVKRCAVHTSWLPPHHRTAWAYQTATSFSCSLTMWRAARATRYQGRSTPTPTTTSTSTATTSRWMCGATTSPWPTLCACSPVRWCGLWHARHPPAGRHERHTPPNQRLESDASSNVLVWPLQHISLASRACLGVPFWAWRRRLSQVSGGGDAHQHRHQRLAVANGSAAALWAPAVHCRYVPGVQPVYGGHCPRRHHNRQQQDRCVKKM